MVLPLRIELRTSPNWFGPQVVVPGAKTPNGQAVVRLILEHREDNADVNIDVIGVGTSPTDVAEMSGVDITPMNGAAATSQRAEASKSNPRRTS